MFTNEDTPLFRVVFEGFSETHYIKNFKKKYKNNWNITRRAIVAQLNNVETLVGTGRIQGPIKESQDKQYAIYKLYFAVAGNKESPKGSGNRVILLVDKPNRTVRILLVYGKNEVGPPNETAKWWGLIGDNYKDLMILLKSS